MRAINKGFMWKCPKLDCSNSRQQYSSYSFLIVQTRHRLKYVRSSHRLHMHISTNFSFHNQTMVCDRSPSLSSVTCITHVFFNLYVYSIFWPAFRIIPRLTSNFSFSHSVFYPLREFSTIFVKIKIVICRFFEFGRV